MRVGINLLQKIQSVNAQPGGFAAAQPMIATSITPFDQNKYQYWIDNFYGVPNNDNKDPDQSTTQPAVPAACSPLAKSTSSQISTHANGDTNPHTPRSILS